MATAAVPGRYAGISISCDAYTAIGSPSINPRAASNRRAFRITQESLDMFRNYFAVYAREQAYCHFSPALIANLERNWDAKLRAE